MPKISALPPMTTAADDDETPIVDDSVGQTKKFTLSFIRSWLKAQLTRTGPAGYLVNGQIVRTVTGSNITVALKTMAGADPSASDPVHVRIGNTDHTITSALSVTKNAGTNWFNAGSAELAAQEIDYFVYLGYNATDGVTIGFSRIPNARIYSDFSATTTNDKYCAISTITTASATDSYELVGRFNATLSASASFNWSVPATSIIINTPIYETRELTYNFVPTNITVGNGVVIARYIRTRKKVFGRLAFTMGSTSSFGTNPTMPLPVSATSDYKFDSLMGQNYIEDAGVSAFVGMFRLRNVTTMLIDGISTNATFAGAAGAAATAPLTWGTNDFFSGNYDYVPA